MTNVTITDINNRIVEMRGRCLSTIKCEIQSVVFDDKEIVYMATEDYLTWYRNEFVFVIPANVKSQESMLARGFWAETEMFLAPLAVE